MDDYLTRVAKAVRDATLDKAWQIGSKGPLRSAVKLPEVIASVPRPEPVARVDSVDEYGPCLSWHTHWVDLIGANLYAEPVAAQPAVPGGWKLVSVESTPEMIATGKSTGYGSVPIYRAMLTAAPEALHVADYEAVIADHARLVRELDVALNGDDAARQASLCDLVAQVKRMKASADALLSAVKLAAASGLARDVLIEAPEAPQTIQCNACNWIGSSSDALYLGGREPIGPLCPECHEKTGPADDAATLREQNAALVAALKAIDDLTGRAGFEFGGPLAVAMKEGLGDRAELLELAGIAGGHFEAISKHTENALASAKGGAA